MIEYKSYPDNNLVEISVSGKITEADFDRVISQMKADIDKHGKLRLLEIFHSFEGIDPIALWKDAKFGLAHLNDFTHVAVVAEPTWMQTFASAVDNLLSAKVKPFESSQVEQARTWLLSTPESNRDSKFEYKSNDNSNIVELVIEGKIIESDFDRVLTQMKADIQKYGKIRILEDIRSFEGADLMVFWKDLKASPLASNVTHAAIVADAKWMRTIAEAVGSIIPMEIKAFERSQIEAAREWLKQT
ncbi:STAS/SEC14 domain-containing protein [Pleurocapsales cyanobacterium LEGE 10410]|nr:STAS/SEC14 domain-containing protein [Pleurocapsales cyanobacterium LEGE 10410]